MAVTRYKKHRKTPPDAGHDTERTRLPGRCEWSAKDRGKTERSGDPPLAKRIVPIHEIGSERSGQCLAKLEQAKDAHASITTGK